MRLWTCLMIVLLSGCNLSQKDVPDSWEEENVVEMDLDVIRERGRLTAIVDNSSTSYFIYKGQPMGYEHDLLKRFCEEQGLELEIVVTKSIEDAFRMLNEGEGDLVAYFLAATKDRRKRVDFTHDFMTTRQVLVQRKPENWRRMAKSAVDRQLIRNQVDLIGKEVTVRKSSSFVQRLHHLSEEIGGDIIIAEDEAHKETEELIRDVLNKRIQYTVADEPIALINSAYYPDLDVETPISFPQQIAWAIRKNAPQLKQTLNEWIEEIKKSSFLPIIHNRYFKISRDVVERAQSDFSSISGNRISHYDHLIQEYAEKIGWDWKLVASLIYQESRFNPEATSWVGAEGLMQVMPLTGREFGSANLFDPEQNISAGTQFLDYLDGRWQEYVSDPEERKKFILASYNAGIGHVLDAIAIAGELKLRTDIWDEHVREAMRLKSDPEYYHQDFVRFGYCRGESVVAYVEGIMNRYQQYELLFRGEDPSN